MKTYIVAALFIGTASLGFAGWFTPHPGREVASETMPFKSAATLTLHIRSSERAAYKIITELDPIFDLYSLKYQKVKLGGRLEYEIRVVSDGRVVGQRVEGGPITDLLAGLAPITFRLPDSFLGSTDADVTIAIRVVDPQYAANYKPMKVIIMQWPYLSLDD